ncbi:hypothetical protein NLI96_g10969 [Meripilus lineatus]|uniref:Uncharacterized protein n=1 Tax=Meripilus lineatus TaxID=2056292 RepID=A0AAD5Y9K8_9APHY|nr:hypothetical protein NLI96_g10969 [Physisporinus lineatus]
MDTISSFCFAKPIGATNAPGFHAAPVIALDTALPLMHIFVHFPTIRKLMMKTPPSWLALWDKSLEGYLHLRTMLGQQIRDILADPSTLSNAPHPIIYHSLLGIKDPIDDIGSINKPLISRPISTSDLDEEAFLLVFAGSDTGGNVLSSGLIRILDNPRVHQRLKQELQEAWPSLENKPRYEDLEKLPYLRAVVKESLRMNHAVVNPMTRVVPKGGASIGGHFVPEGTTVGMSNCFVHWNETLFSPDARVFRPERWLEPEAENLDSWLVSFGKGPRSCLGINLGNCELYLAFANIFRKFDLRLDGFSATDLKWRDVYLPLHIGSDMNIFAAPSIA